VREAPEPARVFFLGSGLGLQVDFVNCRRPRIALRDVDLKGIARSSSVGGFVTLLINLFEARSIRLRTRFGVLIVGVVTGIGRNFRES
jgi:hypothetical protein